MNYQPSISVNQDYISPESNHLLKAVAVAILLHLLLLSISIKQNSTSRPIEVTWLSPALVTKSAPTRRIVSPSETPEQKPPPSTTQVSEKDSQARIEQIKRGLPDVAENPSEKKQNSPAKMSLTKADQKKPQPEQPKPAVTDPKKSKPSGKPQEKQLFLKTPTPDQVSAQKSSAQKSASQQSSQSRLDNLLRGGSASTQSQLSDPARTEKLSQYQPFQQANSAALFRGTRGSADYLPQVQDGEITMLNAKADRHAVFVRRVALQVFGALRRKSWAELSYPQLVGQLSYVTVHAIMSPTGKLLSVEIESSSGRTAFDELVDSAARTGTWDQNPPASARASDGNVHFIYKSRTWARLLGDARREQRWLLLSAGLL